LKKTILTISVICLAGMVYGQENSLPRVDSTKVNRADTTDVESFEEVLVSSQRFARMGQGNSGVWVFINYRLTRCEPSLKQ